MKPDLRAHIAWFFRSHRHGSPLVASLCSAALLAWVFYGSYSKPLEIAGFAGLVLASVWDFHIKKRTCAAECMRG